MTIKDQLDQPVETVEAWRPEPNQELIGTIVKINVRETDQGAYPIYTIREPDGEVLAFHAFHKVARGQLEEAEPHPGDEIGIRYLGQKKSANDRMYHDYRIVIEHRRMSDQEAEDVAAVQAMNEAERAKTEVEPDDSIPF